MLKKLLAKEELDRYILVDSSNKSYVNFLTKRVLIERVNELSLLDVKRLLVVSRMERLTRQTDVEINFNR